MVISLQKYDAHASFCYLSKLCWQKLYYASYAFPGSKSCQSSIALFFYYLKICFHILQNIFDGLTEIPLNTGRSFNVHLLNVFCTFNLRIMSRGLCIIVRCEIHLHFHCKYVKYEGLLNDLKKIKEFLEIMRNQTSVFSNWCVFENTLLWKIIL